jgi:hypothetical protein
METQPQALCTTNNSLEFKNKENRIFNPVERLPLSKVDQYRSV